MLNPAQHAALARELQEAERSRVQVEQFSKRHPAMAIEDSYAIQREWMKLKRAEGRRAIGHKIGLTSRAMQLASQITEPDYGTLLDDMAVRDGGEVETARYIVPRIEVEFAFILARPLKGPGVTLFDVLNATDYVVPALELIDARIEQLDRHTRAPRTVVDTIADNAANAGIVLGGRPMRPDAADWRWGRRAALQERRHRGIGPGRRRAQPPGQRRGVARQQARALRRRARSRRDHLGWVLYPPRALRRGRHVPRRLRTARLDLGAFRVIGGWL
jgi:2-oxo-hept-3-ene-1,7-dioate hydratase